MHTNSKYDELNEDV